MATNKAAGIDLGTTNSCVGIMNETDSDVILHKDKMGVSTTPSCVWYDKKKNEVVVGKRAFRRRGSRPEPVVSIKRKMGNVLLTALGRLATLPTNLPQPLRQVLTETRDERLERFIQRIDEPDPEQRRAKQEALREDPPALWILDQAARLEEYVAGIDDASLREKAIAEPPLLWLPEELSALILAEMQRQIESTADYTVDRAVITVPAYFGSAQIESTKEAGTLAGLRVMEVLQEPTAAAIYYCWKNNIQDGTFLVFDLGGGTFDVSIVRRAVGQFDVPGISGNNFLGGDDMDFVLSEWIREKVMAEDEDGDYELDLDPEDDDDRLIGNRFVLVAEGVKKSLTNDAETWLRDANTVRDKADSPVSIEMVVTREDSDEQIREIVEHCIPKCWEAIARAKKHFDVTITDIDQVFLVGGSTHVPLVAQIVKDHFCSGGEPQLRPTKEEILDEIEGDDQEDTAELRSIASEMIDANARIKSTEPLKQDPDLCVAMGAAVKAASYGTEQSSEAADVSVKFLGPRGTNRDQITIKGEVAAADETTLEGATVRLNSQVLGLDLEIDLDSEHRFLFKKVPLQKRTHNALSVSVRSADGIGLAEAQLLIEQSEHYSEVPTSQDGGPTLSKAISLDVLEGGQLTRRTLVPSGAPLKAEQTHALRVPDPNTGSISFRLYQANRHLKTITTVIDPTLPPGTPIEFMFSISPDHFMKCEYGIGTQEQPESAVIEPPPPAKPPTPEEASLLNRKIEEELGFKSKAEQLKFRNRVRKCNEQIEQARAAGDTPKMIEAYEQLEALHEEIVRLRAELKPPWQEFDDEVSECRKLANIVETEKPDYPVDELRKNLDLQRGKAEKAYGAKDQQEYGELYARVRATRQALEEVLQQDIVTPPPPPPEELAARAIDELLMLVEPLSAAAANFAEQFRGRAKNPPNDETAEENRKHEQQCMELKQNVSGCRAALEDLKPKVEKHPQEVLGQCTSIRNDLQRVQVILTAKQELLAGRGDHTPIGIPQG